MDEEFLINLKKSTEEFKFNGFDQKPTASINRNFSSPINIEFPLSRPKLSNQSAQI